MRPFHIYNAVAVKSTCSVHQTCLNIPFWLNLKLNKLCCSSSVLHKNGAIFHIHGLANRVLHNGGTRHHWFENKIIWSIVDFESLGCVKKMSTCSKQLFLSQIPFSQHTSYLLWSVGDSVPITKHPQCYFYPKCHYLNEDFYCVRKKCITNMTKMLICGITNMTKMLICGITNMTKM